MGSKQGSERILKTTGAKRPGREHEMSPKIIVSYDGTANEDDAVALGAVLGRAGAELALAYVRHTPPPADRRELADAEAQALLRRGADLLDGGDAARHVVTDRSTPDGLGRLAADIGAELIVFCSDSHTAKGHIAVGNSAQRLLEGGATAIAIAPAGLAGAGREIRRIVTVGESGGGGSAQATGEALARALGADMASVADDRADLLVIDSRAGTQPGLVSLSSSALHLIEIARCPVLVVPAARALRFGAAAVAAVA
jgi:nucleotide-binding universal stress UspA family protein